MQDIVIQLTKGHGLENYLADIEQIVMTYLFKDHGEDRPYTDEEKAELETHNYAIFSGISINDNSLRIHVVNINPDDLEYVTQALIEAILAFDPNETPTKPEPSKNDLQSQLDTLRQQMDALQGQIDKLK
jgi:hypothetical protein